MSDQEASPAGDAVAAAAPVAPVAPTPHKDASLVGKRFDLTELEREVCTAILDKAATLRRAAARLELTARSETRGSVLARIGASPETIERAMVALHTTSDGRALAVEVLNLDATAKKEANPLQA